MGSRRRAQESRAHYPKGLVRDAFWHIAGNDQTIPADDCGCNGTAVLPESPQRRFEFHLLSPNRFDLEDAVLVALTDTFNLLAVQASVGLRLEYHCDDRS